MFRNDEVSLDEVAALNPAHIVISPGPCTPNEAGISVPLIKRFAGASSDSRRVSRAPEHRAGVRRQSRACQTGDARQGVADPPSQTKACSRA